MPLTDSLRDDILATVPSLRAFAISLSGNADRADDLVQETLLRALAQRYHVPVTEELLLVQPDHSFIQEPTKLYRTFNREHIRQLI